MSIATFDELKATIEDWLKDDDVAARTEDFIRLVEERHRNELRIRAMEKRATATMDGTRYLPLPTGYLQMRRLMVEGSPNALIQLASPSQLLEYWEESSEIPRFFAVSNQLEFNSLGTSTLEMLYYKELDRLSSSNTSNWLLANAPSVYLYGSLVESAPYIRDDERVQLWEQRYQTGIQELRFSDKAGQRASGPLVSRISGPTP